MMDVMPDCSYPYNHTSETLEIKVRSDELVKAINTLEKENWRLVESSTRTGGLYLNFVRYRDIQI